MPSRAAVFIENMNWYPEFDCTIALHYYNKTKYLNFNQYKTNIIFSIHCLAIYTVVGRGRGGGEKGGGGGRRVSTILTI